MEGAPRYSGAEDRQSEASSRWILEVRSLYDLEVRAVLGSDQHWITETWAHSRPSSCRTVEH